MWATEEEAQANWNQVHAPDCPLCGANPCYFICSNSPSYYSGEQEREDSLYNDSLSYDAWFSLAAQQYKDLHGEDYVS